MKRLVEKLSLHKHKSISVYEGKYIIQIYADAVQGNITRENRTVLCRFCIDGEGICFAFTKNVDSTQFDYTNYRIALDEEMDAVKRIGHEDAMELHDVLVSFCNL